VSNTWLDQPDVDELDLVTVLSALGDRVRLAYVQILAGEQAERRCGHVLDGTEIEISKSTLSHHLLVLRKAGLTRTRIEGTSRYISLRRHDIDARFPGLLDSVCDGSLAAADPA
jgi:DNA-binding transcriptional ArsR family regulator